MIASLSIADLAAALGLDDVALVGEVLDAAHRAGIVFVAGASVVLREPAVSRLRLERDDDGRWSIPRGLLDAVPARAIGLDDTDAADQADPRQVEPWEALTRASTRAEDARRFLAMR